MKFRQLKVIATGQWVDVLFTVQADAFSVPPESHQADIARALAIVPAELEVVEGDADVRIGPLLSLPPPPGPQPDASSRRRSRIAELLAIARSDWTTAQLREIAELTAQEFIR